MVRIFKSMKSNPGLSVFVACTLLVLPVTMAFKGVNNTFNPHEGLTDNIITSWDHRDGIRFPQPSVIRAAWENMNYRSSFKGNIDRPTTSKVSPVMINPLVNGYDRYSVDQSTEPPTYEGSRDDLVNAHALLEEYQLEHQPVPRRPNGKNYKFNKLFNFDDINQWRVHHPTKFVSGLNDIGRPVSFVTDNRWAPEFCVAGYDVNGNPYSYTEPDGECEASKAIFKNETYSIFLEKTDDEGLNFGTHISQLNYVKHGHIRSTGDNKVSIEYGNSPNEKPTVTFQQRLGLIDFDDRYVEANSYGERYLRIRHINKEEGYGPVRYIQILTKDDAGL